MPHLIVDQLAFARTELVRSLAGVTPEEAVHRFLPMNSLSWIVGHLANHEQRLLLVGGGLAPVVPGLNDLVGSGQPASTPPLADMWAAWEAITVATEPVLESMTVEQLTATPSTGGPPGDSTGTNLQRLIYHYWFHIGEGQAIRQLLGHTDLPSFIGAIGRAAPFRVE
jgi:hypothetical protein